MISSRELQVSVNVGPYKVLSNSVLHVRKGSTIDLKIADLPVRFQFKDDEGATRYEGGMNGGTLTMTLFNHKNALGEGIFDPITFGSSNGLDLSFTYYAHRMSDDAFKFELCLLGKEQA